MRFIDPVNLLASFDAGKNGLEAEDAVAARGLTIGHWPQSVAVSSVGGWVATRASGQFSTAYGNIEDIVYSIEAVLPTANVGHPGQGAARLGRAGPAPPAAGLAKARSASSPASPSRCAARRRRRPCARFEAPSMRAGFDLQREIIQRGWRPPVMRQYDERESRRARRARRSAACLILMVHEGPAALVAAELEAVDALAAEMGVARRAGRRSSSTGSSTATPCRTGTRSWQRGMVVDTVEVAADVGRDRRGL